VRSYLLRFMGLAVMIPRFSSRKLVAFR
jgi:hypothetical protein